MARRGEPWSSAPDTICRACWQAASRPAVSCPTMILLRRARRWCWAPECVRNCLQGKTRSAVICASAGQRYRVIGVMEPKGQMLGFDMDDTVFIPAARALELFNRPGLMEIQLSYKPGADLQNMVRSITALLKERHGREDFTLIPQEKALEVLGSVLDVITFAVGALGGISLLVGGVGILTIMTMAVSERTAEIGLLRALGARENQVLTLFLGEAILLSALGGLAGLALGIGIAQGLHLLIPALPVHTPWLFAVIAELSAISIGMAAGVMPARRAARLDPVEALRSE
jgi:putative ABC transport system permease protein